MERTSDRPLALSAAPGPRHPDRPKAERFSREALQAWMQYMEEDRHLPRLLGRDIVPPIPQAVQEAIGMDSEARVSEQTWLGVWQSLYDQERLVRYYERLRDLLARKVTACKWVLFIVAGTELMAEFLWMAVGDWGAWPRYISMAATGILVILLISPFYRRAETNLATADSIMTSCRRQKTETESLWRDIMSADCTDREARQRITRIEQELNAITAAKLDGVGVNDELNQRCEDEAYRVLEGKTAHA